MKIEYSGEASGSNLSKAEALVERMRSFMELPEVKDSYEAIKVLKNAEASYQDNRAVLSELSNKRHEFEEILRKKLDSYIN